MKKEKIRIADLGLLYLSNFEEGLSYYNWDRGIIYGLKSRSHPNEILAELKSRSLIEVTEKEGSRYYVLTESGSLMVGNLKGNLKLVFEKILNVIEELKLDFDIKDVIINEPVFMFNHSGRKYKIIVEVDDENICLRALLPADTKLAVNDLQLSLNMFNTTFLKDLLSSNMTMYKTLNSKDLPAKPFGL